MEHHHFPTLKNNYLKKNKFAFSLIEMSVVLLVIGAFLTAILSARLLIKSARLESARNLTRNSPITSMKGVFMWMETVSENSFEIDGVADGDKVALWKNIITNYSQGLSFS